MKPFTHLAMPGRVVHGAGRVSELADEIAMLGAERVMFCCTESRVPEVEILAATLGDRFAGICDAAKIFVPLTAVEPGRKMAEDLNADCLVSYGGGTAVGPRLLRGPTSLGGQARYRVKRLRDRAIRRQMSRSTTPLRASCRAQRSGCLPRWR